VARLKVGFGDPRGHVSVEHFCLVAGTDITPLLHRFTRDVGGGVSNWGYVIEGSLSVSYSDGSTDTIEPGDVFYMSFGHMVSVEQDCELLILRSGRAYVEVLAPVQMRMSKYCH
jgi:hypothetical protein